MNFPSVLFVSLAALVLPSLRADDAPAKPTPAAACPYLSGANGKGGAAACASCASCDSGEGWQKTLAQELPVLGHRNWIVIVDSAYPWQVSPGVETVETNAALPDVLQSVLQALGQARHVRPNVFTDAELSRVPEADAPGIGAYRAQLAKILAAYPVATLPHAELIAKLDEVGKTFHVLLLKTTLALPYTSVFLQLDCAYWNAGAEKRLRDANP